MLAGLLNCVPSYLYQASLGALAFFQQLLVFGRGFYCGESLRQATSFIARFPHPVWNFVALDAHSLRSAEFPVCNGWMLAVALYRGKLR